MIKEWVVGILILGSVSVQAARGLRQPSNTSSGSYTPMKDTVELIREHGYEKAKRPPIFFQAIKAVRGAPGQEGKDWDWKMPETDIIYWMAENNIQINLGKEWAENGAKENVMQFLEEFIEFSSEFSVSEAFDEALKKLGLAAPPHLQQARQEILDLIKAGRLFEFFENEN